MLLSKGNLLVVGKNPPGKPFHKGGNASILNPNHEYGVLCQFVLGGKKILSFQRILRENNIDTVRRKQAFDTVSHSSLLSTHHACNRLNNSTEKRVPTPTIHIVYQKLIESEGWDISKKQ